VIPVLKLYLLGGFRLLADEAAVMAINTPRLQSLLAYLVLHRHAPHPRSHLAFLFWPDSTEAQARTNLRYLIHQLRHALPQVELYLHTGDGALHWRADATFSLDVAEFEQAITQADRAEQAGDLAEMRTTLEQAVALYQGDLLPSCYDEWLLPERERLSQRFSAALERLILLLESQRDYPSAIGYSQRLLRYDPLLEAAYHHLMRLHTASGDRVGALRVYYTCAAVLEREMAVEPSVTIRAEYERLLRQEPPAGLPELSPTLISDVSPLHLPGSRPNNLPIQLSSFIGRERELAEIKRLLAGARLLTLTGPGGCGKTRLALEAATELLLGQLFADGVWWVELATLADPALIVQAVASALGVQEQPRQLLWETLLDYLRPRNLLLTLDNCEHLVATCAQLVEELLRACPKLKVLATSREPLSIAGETTWLTPSLSLPDPHQLPSESEEAVSDLSQYEAVRLFVERAASTLPTFTLTQHNAVEMVQICQRLDGIPLAIELAAARVKVLTVPQIAGRLDDCFKLLTAGSRTVGSRHQTLRAAIDWSYDLLSEPERVLFQRLAVFEGGFTLEAAETVCAGQGIESSEILELLSHLVDKSLVVVGTPQQGWEARYRLLETIRQYGRDKLLASAEAGSMRQQHAAYYLTLAEQAWLKLQGPEQLAWLNRLEVEHDNLRAALSWSQVEAGETGLRLAGALGLFWYLHGYWSEGRGWLESMLTQTEGLGYTQARAKALLDAGTLAHYQGDYGQAALLLEESLTLHRTLPNTLAQANALYQLSQIEINRGNWEAAISLLEEAQSLPAIDQLALVRVWYGLADTYLRTGVEAKAREACEACLRLAHEIGDTTFELFALNRLGTIETLFIKDYAKAQQLYEQCLALARRVGNREREATALSNLGANATYQGDHQAAIGYTEAALTIQREIGDKVGMIISAGNLADSCLEIGAPDQALPFLREAINLARQMESPAWLLANVIYIAQLRIAQGDIDAALPLLGLVRHHPAASAENRAVRVDEILDKVRGTRSEAEIETGMARGKDLDVDAVIEAFLKETRAAGH
jgi:predicted ATPase/DNA-binding SARP family transcriptional activator